MIIVTGGAGFIGSSIIRALNERGRSDIIVVDNLKNIQKSNNLKNCNIYSYVDKDCFFEWIHHRKSLQKSIEVVFHEGACSDTTNNNIRHMIYNNFQYSKCILEFCLNNSIQLVYASSASVYGTGRQGFREDNISETPLNIYAYSKYLFDLYVQKFLPNTKSQIVGLRYFNVYGPRESHKGVMASLAYQFDRQLKHNGIIKPFKGIQGVADGEQRRDFVYIDDIVDVTLWFYENSHISGIFNVGTGQSRSVNDIAHLVMEFHGYGAIDYISFPKYLIGHYQIFTESDNSYLLSQGWNKPFLNIEEGIGKYLELINNESFEYAFRKIEEEPANVA
ncbi:MAG: ADP-glyceromanno-heptose 6-epimerase [Candidatus Thiodiazotropha taylori]